MPDLFPKGIAAEYVLEHVFVWHNIIAAVAAIGILLVHRSRQGSGLLLHSTCSLLRMPICLLRTVTAHIP